MDCGEDDPDAKDMVDPLNRLYQEEHKHRTGVDGWTEDRQLAYRQQDVIRYHITKVNILTV